ncbi:MAG: hypothetical protein GF355_11465 [Candidatus Eisenbacteria bacterium]|nr:hypothetical protein [Candidatus Eisenbacteria bacterium]
MSSIPIVSRPHVLAGLLSALLLMAAPVADSRADDGSLTPYQKGPRDEVLQRVGFWPYGQSLAVSVDEARRLAFAGSGGAVLVLDIEDMSSPRLLSDSIHTLGLVLDACYDHDTQRLFLACGEGGLEIWDVADPLEPVLLVNSESPGYPLGGDLDAVEVSGHFAIIDYGGGGIWVLDVSDPANPVHVGGSAETGNGNNDIFLAKGGYLHGVGPDYRRFYIDAGGQLHVNGSTPDYIGGGSEVAGSNDIAYLVQGGQILIVDPVDHVDPVYATYNSGYNISDIDIRANYLYYTRDFNREMAIVDVAHPYAPFEVSTYTFPSTPPTAPQAIELDGPNVHLAGGYSGYWSMDASDPIDPQPVGNYETFSRGLDVERHGAYAYMAEEDDGVLVIDLSDLAAPVLVGQYDTPGWSRDVDIAGELLYVADADGGLRIADLAADPTAPVEIASADVGDPYYVKVAGGFAYVIDLVIDGSDWLRIVDVSDPSAPVERGSYLIPGEARGLAPAGDYLCIAAKDAGLRIVDVSDPDAPVEAASYVVPGVLDVEVAGDRAYVSSWDYAEGGFLILDLSDPENPALVSRYPEPGPSFFKVEVIGDFAYLTAPTSNQLYVLYLADEEDPLELGHYVTPGELFDVTASDSLVLVPDGSAGLRVLENVLYTTPGGGVGWEPLESGTTEHLRDVHFTGPSTGWVVGDDGLVLHSDDGGDSWTPQTSGTAEDLFAVDFVDSQIGWIGGRSGVLHKTTDGGQNWSPQASGTTYLVKALQFASAETGWAVCTGGRILHTTNGGQHWASQTSGVGATLDDVNFIDDQRGWIAVDSEGLMLETDDGGANWIMRYIPTDERPSGVSFTSASTGWVCTSDAEVFRTEDGGETWTEQLLEDENPDYSLSDIQFVDASHGNVVGSKLLEGRSYGTTDGGANWIEIHGARENYLQALHLVDAAHGWAVGHHGTILRLTAGASGVPDDDRWDVPRATPAMLEIRSNPLHLESELCFTLRETAEIRLEIFDAGGRRLAVPAAGRYTAGEHAVTWAGRDDRGRPLGPGVYFVRLQANGVASIRKLVVLK